MWLKWNCLRMRFGRRIRGAAIRMGDLQRFGEYMAESHQSRA
jgi:hypothetical protein